MPKHKGSSKPSSAGLHWSEAVWSEEYKRYYFLLLDRNGAVQDQRWDGETQEEDASQVPRGGGGIEDLTGRFASASINENQAHAYQGYHDGQYTEEANTNNDDAHDPPSPDYTHKSRSGKGKGKGKVPSGQTSHPAYAQDPQAQQMPNSYPDTYGHPQDQYYGDTQNQYPDDGYGQGAEDMQEAMNQSRQEYYGTVHDGEASASAAYQNYDPAGDEDYYNDPSPYPGYGQNIPHATAASGSTPMYGGEGSTTFPGSSQADPQMVAGANMDNYRVEHSARFQPGEIFKILWSEPRGAQALDGLTERNPYDSDFYIGIRRFIVIATDEGHSTCVPILTYEKKGCTKKGVRPNKHGVVYERGGKPRLLKDEGPLGFPPVAVKLHIDDEKLAKESRVNYSKLVTIEHNTRVYFIGSIVGKDLKTVHDSVDDCWGNKKVKRVNRRDHKK